MAIKNIDEERYRRRMYYEQNREKFEKRYENAKEKEEFKAKRREYFRKRHEQERLNKFNKPCIFKEVKLSGFVMKETSDNCKLPVGIKNKTWM